MNTQIQLQQLLGDIDTLTDTPTSRPNTKRCIQVGSETYVIFGQRRPDSLAIDWINKMVYVLEFKRTSDQRRDYREKGEERARAQHDVLIRSLGKVAGETESEGERWKAKLIVFVGVRVDRCMCSQSTTT